MTGVLIKRGLGHRCSDRETPRELEGRDRVVCPQAKKHRRRGQNLGSWAKGPGQIPLTGSGDPPWISDFQPLELGEDRFLKFKQPIWGLAGSSGG